MQTITIQIEDKFVNKLEQIAQIESITTEEVAKEVLLNYLKAKLQKPDKYSFIGIGHSGKGNISSQVGEILRNGANKREGWSLNK